MSNAATTIPARRSAYNANTPRISAHKSDNVTKRKMGAKTRSIQSNADILVVTHTHACKDKSKSKIENHRHFDDNQDTLVAKHKDAATIRKASLGKPTSGGNIKGDSVLSTKTLPLHQYEQLHTERQELKSQNDRYAERVNELENELASVIDRFSKLSDNGKHVKEPTPELYSRVFEDRKILRAAERGYKKRIHSLETEVKEKQNANDRLQNELKHLKEKLKQNTEKLIKGLQQKEAKLERDITKLRNENKELQSQIETLEIKVKPTETEKIQTSNDYTHKKPKILPINQEKVKRVKFTDKGNGEIGDRIRFRNDMHHQNMNTEVEEKREKFYYEYLLPDSLEEDT